MKSGFELLIKSSAYTQDVLEDFEKLSGKLPEDYKDLILNYKSGYPSMEHFEDVEIVANSNYNPKVHFIESFFTLFRAYDILLNLDRAFGLNANHRKYKLLPICSSGSSYKEYYLKLDTGEIYFLNPNSDMDVELDLESKKLANNVNEFVESFVCQSID